MVFFLPVKVDWCIMTSGGIRTDMNDGSKKKEINNKQTRCDDCEFFYYDDEYEQYVCNMSLDEDEMERFMAGNTSRCPYYRQYDEYGIVRKQN